MPYLKHRFACPAIAVIALLLLSGCSAEKFLSDGQTILSETKLVSTDKGVDATQYERCIRQRPNSKWFGAVKVPLGIYCMAGRDTSRHHRLHRMGQPPVTYDSLLAVRSVADMRSALVGQGYLHAGASLQQKTRKRRTKVTYTLSPGTLYTIDHIDWKIEHDSARAILSKKENMNASALYKGMPCDVSILETERDRIVRLLQDAGYYYVNRDFINFIADTTSSSRNVSLTVNVSYIDAIKDSLKAHRRYKIGRVNVYYNMDRDSVMAGRLAPTDTVSDGANGSLYVYGRPLLRDKILLKNVLVREGKYYNSSVIQSTFRRLSALPLNDYSSIDIREDTARTLRSNGPGYLTTDVNFHTQGINSVGFEVEGTNMAGDLGAAAAVSYENRNLFHGAEDFDIKLRGAFEALGGLEDYNNNENYIEFTLEANLKMPILIKSLQKRNHSSVLNSVLSLVYNTQDRPEFHRRTLTASVRYTWNSWMNHLRHRLDLISLNYVFMPWISDTFRRDYLENNTSRNSILRYSYEDLFIMRSAYSLVYNSSKALDQRQLNYKDNAYSMKFSLETAGNLLYLISELFHAPRNADGHYKLFNIAFAQYAKADFDFVKNFVIDERNAVALHTNLGIALPYGNATIVPYEKRYFAGGANSVRGWQVRGLGPGKYRSNDGKIDFINQTGNLKFDFSLEYRTFLFWKLHGAIFADAGNIWTTRDYPDQAGGKFEFHNFLKQLAVAYGLGLRFNLDYFVLRFDGGMKAVNPYYTSTREHFPLLHPRFSRDFTLHFAVGLPF